MFGRNLMRMVSRGFWYYDSKRKHKINTKADEIRREGRIKEADDYAQVEHDTHNKKMWRWAIPLILAILIFGSFLG